MLDSLIRTALQWLQTGREFCNNWSAFIGLEVLFKLISLAVFTPAWAYFFNAILQSSGDPAVSNYDLISFFLSPQGLIIIATFATSGFAILFFEIGGLVLIAIAAGHKQKISAIRTLQHLTARLPGLFELGLRQFVVLAAISLVALIVSLATKFMLLSGGDIYFYLNVKPPEFWITLLVSSIAFLLAASVVFFLLIRWIFSVPMMLLNNMRPRQAMTASWSHTKEIGFWRIAGKLILWGAVLVFAIGLCSLTDILISKALLWLAGEQVELVIIFSGLLLTLSFLLGLFVSFFGVVTLSMTIAGLYLEKEPEAQLPAVLISGRNQLSPLKRLRLGSLIFSAAIAVVCLSVFFAYTMISQIQIEGSVAVTAHRGSSAAAPENSMAAVLQAVKDGADFAEIDVQETADGVVVLFHDTDLRRMAGINKGIWEISFDDMRKLDIGSWFSKEFSNTRVATLEEVIQAVKGKMKLNIELKFNGHSRKLESEVVRIIRATGFEEECVITSLHASGVRNVARLDKTLLRGLIVTANIGDITRLDVQILAVNANAVNRDLIRRAHKAGMEVHVWTVNDPGQMLTMIHLGVDNIMTDSPDLLVELLRARENLSNIEKSMLFVSDFLSGRL